MFDSTESLDPLLELLSRAESDHGTGGDRDLLAGLGVAPRALVLAAQVEVAEARQLDLAALLQRAAQGVEERVDELLRLALVQADLVEQTLRHLRLGQRHAVTYEPPLGPLSPGSPRHGRAAGRRSPPALPHRLRGRSACALLPAKSSP